MKQFYFLFSFLLYAAVLTGQERLHLHPEAPQGHMEQGREYISLENGEIMAELAYDGPFESYYVFDLVLVNQGTRALSVNPASFYYLHLDQAGADSSVLPPILATRPGHILKQYEALLEERQSNSDIHTVFGFVDAGISALSAASAFFASEDPFTLVDGIIRTASAAEHHVSVHREMEDRADLLRMEMDVVKEEIMKKGSIPPGKVLSGFVFFPVFEEPGYLMFSIPVEDRLFQFVYRQD